MARVVLHHVISNLSQNGAELMLLRLLSRIDRSLFSPVVTSLTDNVPLAHRFRDIDVPVYTMGLCRGVPDPRGITRVARLFKRTNTELVQTWMYHADLIGGLAAKISGSIPVIWNIRHSNLDFKHNKWSTILTARACAALSRFLPVCIVCCAESARKSHVDFGYNDNSIEILPNGFDIDRFYPDSSARKSVRAELDIPQDGIIVGLVARFHPQKDLFNFIRAAAHIEKSNDKIFFVMCGENVEWCQKPLSEAIDSAGIKNKVRLLGRRNDIPRIVAGFDVATSSSLGEGFPNAVGEAMACGIPCVVTNVGDSALLVGNSGLVVPSQDPMALAEAWRHLIDLDPAEKRMLGARARLRIETQFSLDVIVNRYQQLYLDVMKKIRPASL